MARDVGDYRAEQLLGFGGSSEVWRARHRRTGEEVALKWVRRGAGADRVGERPRQMREAALLAAVAHPHLVGLREVLSDHGDPVLVLDLLPGGSLAQLLSRRGRLAPGEVVTVLAPIAAALAYAHDEGLVHGDITPGNILFTAAGRPVLTDLGLARVIGEPVDPTETGCTPEYVDPLVAAGAAPAAASDVFGLGAVAFHALTGSPPWSAAGPAETLAVAARGDVPDPGALLPEAVVDVAADLVDVVARAMHPQPTARGTAAEFALDLRHSCVPEAVRFDGTAGVSPGIGIVTQAVPRPRPPGAGPAHAAPDRRPGSRPAVRRVLIVVAAMSLVAATLVVGVRWGRGGAPAAAGPPPAVGVTSGPSATAPDPSATAPDPPTTGEFAVPTAPAGWAALLDTLYRRRAGAFATNDGRVLDGVYTARSPQAATDRVEITRLAQRGLVVDGFAPQVVSVVSARGSPPEMTLRVTDEFGPYAVVEDGRVVQSHPGREAAAVEIRLVMTAVGWRIDTATRLA